MKDMTLIEWAQYILLLAIFAWWLTTLSGCSSHGIEFRVGYVPLNSADIRQGFDGKLAHERERWKRENR